MALKKKGFERFDDYDAIRKEKLSKSDLKKQDKLIKAEAQALRIMQETISHAVATYMAEEEIGINELTRRLDTSSRQTSRIMKGEANITLATIAHLASLMKKTPKIRFE